jgi:hypothetical protein
MCNINGGVRGSNTSPPIPPLIRWAKAISPCRRTRQATVFDKVKKKLGANNNSKTTICIIIQTMKRFPQASISPRTTERILYLVASSYKWQDHWDVTLAIFFSCHSNTHCSFIKNSYKNSIIMLPLIFNSMSIVQRIVFEIF